MTMDRGYISEVADVVRDTLALKTPITLEELIRAIEELGGRCIPGVKEEMGIEAQISTPSEEHSEYRFTIQYLEGKPAKRILFSIAHEVGHLVLHLLGENGTLLQDETFARGMHTTQKELEANEFAAALLMPAEEFILKCEEMVSGNKISITKVAECFNVSVQAATVRGNVLGLW
ncbi:MAG: ImmA/IrrE family metallo-endopeptidase [Tyzzerella sp.]|nr:ImmA/IrrE family metallo-endopeptidase [Tyzzerella sp.]